jgi:hypothetical protein
MFKDQKGRIIVKVSDFDIAKDALTFTADQTLKGCFSIPYSSP